MWFTHSPELLKTGRFDLSTIISWQCSTIKRVVRSTLAAEGYAVSEGLESAQWFRHLLTVAHMARSSLKNVEKESLRRSAHVFTDNDSLANTVKKDVGQSHDETSGQCKKTCLDDTYSAQLIAGIVTCEFEADLLRCENRNRALSSTARAAGAG